MSLSRLRAEIDAIDRQLLVLFARRFRVAEEVAAHKAKARLKPRIASRIRHVIQNREREGLILGMPRNSAANIWKAVIEETCKFEEIRIPRLRPRRGA